MRTPDRRWPATLAEVSALDVVAGFPLGGEAALVTLPAAGGPPWSALQEALLPALLRAPAVVAFSGGRDSALLLAAATSAARLHGLPLPLPVTMRFEDAPSTFENDWQERTVRHLGLDEWQVVAVRDELDLLGDLAVVAMDRHGPQYPANAHSMAVVAPFAAGGTLVTGIGGDQLFGSWRWRRRSAVLHGQHLLRPMSWAAAALGSCPSGVRRRVLRRRLHGQMQRPGFGYSWLTDDGRAALLDGLAQADDQPTSWPGFVVWAASQRATTLCTATVARMAADHGAGALAPLLDPAFLGALSRAGGASGFADRTSAMAAVGSEGLPAEVLTRTSKALFHEAFWRDRARAFAASWDGRGVDPALVDAPALRHEWLSPQPDFRSLSLLHHAWAHSRDRAARPASAAPASDWAARSTCSPRVPTL